MPMSSMIMTLPKGTKVMMSQKPTDQVSRSTTVRMQPMLNDNGAGWSLGRGSNGGATMGSQGPNQQSRGASNQNGIANTMNMNLWGNDDTDAMSSWSGDNNGMGSWSADDNDAMPSWTNDDDNNGMPSLDMTNNNGMDAWASISDRNMRQQNSMGNQGSMWSSNRNDMKIGNGNGGSWRNLNTMKSKSNAGKSWSSRDNGMNNRMKSIQRNPWSNASTRNSGQQQQNTMGGNRKWSNTNNLMSANGMPQMTAMATMRPWTTKKTSPSKMVAMDAEMLSTMMQMMELMQDAGERKKDGKTSNHGVVSKDDLMVSEVTGLH